MKKTLITLTLIITQALCGMTFGQELSEPVYDVFKACCQLRAAIGAGSTAQLKTANDALKECETCSFYSLRALDETPVSLDGHFIFNSYFVDSLIATRSGYEFSERYASEEPRSARIGDYTIIHLTTRAVAANSSAKFSFVTRGHQELAVVTEPGGKVTLRIHDKTHNVWYNDTKDVTLGQETRYQVFDLPDSDRSSIELEVINTTGRDISFAVISN